jgi:hypothetical protein
MPVSDVLARVAELEALAARSRAQSVPQVTAQPASDFSAFLSAAAARNAAPVQQELPQRQLLAQLATLGSPSPAATSQPALGALLAPGVVAAAYAPVAPPAGLRALAAAAAEVGVREEPPGSNDGPRIAEYRAATAGSAPGVPWCAYFVSWAAGQAGAPIGEEGQGYGAVEEIEAWARRTGRFLPVEALPQPGDLILFGGRHVGIVESVNGDGSLATVEGNHQDAVSRVQRGRFEGTGFVRL